MEFEGATDYADSQEQALQWDGDEWSGATADTIRKKKEDDDTERALREVWISQEKKAQEAMNDAAEAKQNLRRYEARAAQRRRLQ